MSKQGEILKKDAEQLARVTEKVAGALVQVDPVLAMIERVAKDPNADVAKLEKMLDMQERVLRTRAELEFNEAMSKCQAALSVVVADAENPQTRSKYAS